MLHVTSTQSGGPRDTQKMIADAARDAAVDVVKYWHDRYLPEHFTVAGGKKYGYQPRKGDNEPPRVLRSKGKLANRTVSNNAYSWQKRRKFGHNKPLVYTGASEQAAKAVVKLSSRIRKADGQVVGTAAMPALPKYFYQYRKDLKAPDKADELTRTTSSEQVDLTVVFQASAGTHLSNARKFPQMKRIT